MEKVYERLVAPHKEMIEFYFNDHMMMVNHPQEVCEKLTEVIKEARYVWQKNEGQGN